MTLPLVVGVDGSDGSLQALDWAVDEATRGGLPLRLVHASLWERYEGALPTLSRERSSETVLAEHVVASAAERVLRQNPDLRVSTEIVAAEAVPALLDEGRNAAALITGSRGRGELKGTLLGSVSLAVAARAHVPVVVVRGDKAALTGSHGRVLLGPASRTPTVPRSTSPSSRRRRAGVRSRLSAPGGARRRRRATPRRRNRRTGTRNRRPGSSTPWSPTRAPAIRRCRCAGRRWRARPARCSCTTPPRPTWWSSALAAGTGTSGSSSAGSATPCCTMPRARWPSYPSRADRPGARPRGVLPAGPAPAGYTLATGTDQTSVVPPPAGSARSNRPSS